MIKKEIRDSKLLKEIDSWKFSIDPTPLLIAGRVSSERVVHFAQGETFVMESPGDWTNFFRNPRLRFHEQKSLTTNQGNWIIVYERNTYRTVEEFIRNFREVFFFLPFIFVMIILNKIIKKVSEKLGLEGNKPDLHEISNDRPESYVAKIKEVCQDTKNKIPLVVCILNSKQASRYEAIKRLLTIEIPIPSQCIVATFVFLFLFYYFLMSTNFQLLFQNITKRKGIKICLYKDCSTSEQQTWRKTLGNRRTITRSRHDCWN